MTAPSPFPIRDFSFSLIEYIRSWNRYQKTQPLHLGGAAGSPGSVGRPGGYYGLLPQNRVQYDSIEDEYSSGGSTLMDNLAHDRFRLTTYMEQVAAYEDSGGSICSNGSVAEGSYPSYGSGASIVGFSPGSPTGVTNVQTAIEKLYNDGPSGYFWHTFTFTVVGNLSVSSGNLRFSSPGPMTIGEVRLEINTAPTDQSILVDIHKNGTTIFTDQGKRPEIADGAYAGTSSTPDVVALVKNDYITMDVDQVGSTIAGGNLTIEVRCKQYIQGD